MYAEDEFLALSGIQHYAFCRRQWALIHIEQTWSDNLLTTEGDLMHRRAHDEALRERRGDLIVVRGLTVHSYALGLVGVCDVVEFHADKKGHPLVGEDGLWRALPVEYKHGRSKTIDADRLQLCAQAICLEEMLGCSIDYGYLYYGSTRDREQVEFDKSLREKALSAAEGMHDLYKRKHTPNVRSFSACRSCSLSEDCLSKAMSRMTVEAYLKGRLDEESL